MGRGRRFAFADRGDFLESVDEIPEPHAFAATVTIGGRATHGRIRGARACATTPPRATTTCAPRVIHVMADAAVSVLVIVGLTLARTFGWLWMDPLAGLVGACVIASWSTSLIRDTGAILLDMNPDQAHGGAACARRHRGGRRPGSPTCTFGASDPAISARSSRS